LGATLLLFSLSISNQSCLKRKMESSSFHAVTSKSFEIKKWPDHAFTKTTPLVMVSSINNSLKRLKAVASQSEVMDENLLWALVRCNCAASVEEKLLQDILKTKGVV